MITCLPTSYITHHLYKRKITNNFNKYPCPIGYYETIIKHFIVIIIIIIEKKICPHKLNIH